MARTELKSQSQSFVNLSRGAKEKKSNAGADQGDNSVTPPDGAARNDQETPRKL